MNLPPPRLWFLATGALLLAVGLTTGLLQAAAAQPRQTPQQDAGPPLHPDFALLDEQGVNVLESGGPASTLATCGQCHAPAFIQEHSFHADLGRGQIVAAGEVDGGRPWDTSPGAFGRWNPLTYRYLSPQGDERTDLTTAEWLMGLGSRHVGGGPAVPGRDGTPLA